MNNEIKNKFLYIVTDELVRVKKIFSDICPTVFGIFNEYKLLATLTAIILCGTLALCFYRFVRSYHILIVNCWFCNKDSSVKRENSNCFVCPFCHQYNGFDKEGDYNRVIPGQLSSSYNYPSSSKLSYTKYSKSVKGFKNGFCNACNTNQGLKIRALAEFSNNDLYKSTDLENFKLQLEDIYALCQQCQAALRQTLGKQDSWLKPKLIAWRLTQTKNKLKLSAEEKHSHKWNVFIACLMAATLAVLVSSACHFASRGWTTGTEGSLAGPFGSHLSSVYHGLLPAFAVISLTWLAISKNIKGMCFLSCGLLPLLLIEYVFLNDGRTLLAYVKALFTVLNFTITAIIIKNSRNVSCGKKVEFSKKFLQSVEKETCLLATRQCEAKELPKDVSRDLSTPPPIAVEKKEGEDAVLDSGLLGLKIGTPQKQTASSRSSSPFPQNLFLGNNESNGTKLIIQPSKLGKNLITQSSWVAGGYWGTPGSPQRGRLTRGVIANLAKEQPSLSNSRSSSQSSGFFSQFSEGASSHSIPKLFSSATSTTSSQESSLASDDARPVPAPLGKPNVFNTSAFGFPAKRNLDNFELFSACSASSLCSGNSRVRQRSPFMGSDICRSHSPSLAGSEYNFYDYRDNNAFVNSAEKAPPPETSYFSLGLAFVLGISVSANLFLIVILNTSG